MNIVAFAALGLWLGRWRFSIALHWPMLGFDLHSQGDSEGATWRVWLGPFSISFHWPHNLKPWPITADAGAEINYYALSCKLQLPVEQWWGLRQWPECDSEKNRSYMVRERESGVTAGWIASRKLFVGPVQVWWAYPG